MRSNVSLLFLDVLTSLLLIARFLGQRVKIREYVHGSKLQI